MSSDFILEERETLLTTYSFDVERRVVRHDGTSFERQVAVHPGAVAILAIDESGAIGVIRQYRATVNRVTYEIPAGTRDVAGEEPLATAKRELEEEMGVRAHEWRLLGRFMNSPGWTDQIMHIYEATNLQHGERRPAGPEERSSDLLWLNPDELRAVLRAEPAIDSTMAVALNRVYGRFFD